MRLWKQPLSVWMLSAVVTATAASVGAQQNPIPSADETPARAKIVDAIRVDGDRGIAPPSRLKPDEERQAPSASDGASKLPQAPKEAFAGKLSTLWRCKYQVAKDQRKKPAEVTAGRALVRFDVDQVGKALAPTVVALEPTSPEVLTCAANEIQNWRMSPAPGQAMRVETEVSLAGPAS